MMQREDQFFTDPGLPFIQWRRSRQNSRTFREHLHSSLSVGMIEEGEVSFQVAGHNHRLLPGMLALINPETIHACNPPQGQPRSFSMLHLEMEWCLRVQQALWAVDSYVPIQAVTLADVDLVETYRLLLKVLVHPHHRLDREQALTHFAATLFLRACDPTTQVESLPLDVEQVKAALADNLEQDLSLTELARGLGVNPYTLLRRFHRATGLTPHKWRMQCRIERAKELLRRQTDLTEIALSCGFFDQSHFNRFFVQATAVTPKQYQDGCRIPNTDRRAGTRIESSK
jgi:AraC-like DNA-binding protein